MEWEPDGSAVFIYEVTSASTSLHTRSNVLTALRFVVVIV